MTRLQREIAEMFNEAQGDAPQQELSKGYARERLGFHAIATPTIGDFLRTCGACER